MRPRSGVKSVNKRGGSCIDVVWLNESERIREQIAGFLWNGSDCDRYVDVIVSLISAFMILNVIL